MNSGRYLPSREAARFISTTFTDTEVNNCFIIYHTSWITSGLKSNFICENVPTKAILFFFGSSEVNSTWLITYELANQSARKVLFSCVVYTNNRYLDIIAWGRVGYEEFCRSRRVLSTEAEGHSASVVIALCDLQNCSYPTKAVFNNCFIIHSKSSPVLKGVLPFRSFFFCSPEITQPSPLVFSVNGTIICSGLHFWCHSDVTGSIICSVLHFWRHWLNIGSTAAS